MNNSGVKNSIIKKILFAIVVTAIVYIGFNSVTNSNGAYVYKNLYTITHYFMHIISGKISIMLTIQ